MKNTSSITQIHLKDFEIMFVLSKKKKEKKKHGLNHQLHLKDCEILLDLCKKKKKIRAQSPNSTSRIVKFCWFCQKKKHELPNESPNSTSRIIKLDWFCLKIKYELGSTLHSSAGSEALARSLALFHEWRHYLLFIEGRK